MLHSGGEHGWQVSLDFEWGNTSLKGFVYTITHFGNRNSQEEQKVEMAAFALNCFYTVSAQVLALDVNDLLPLL